MLASIVSIVSSIPIAACAFAACALAFAACAPMDTTIDTTFDPCAPVLLDPIDASDAQRGSVERAAAWWNERAGSQLVLRDAAPDRRDVSDAPVVPVRFDDANAAFRGAYDDETGVVYVNSGIASDRARAVVVAHEVGHAFGLVHAPDDTDSVMIQGNLTTTPTDRDARELADAWGACAPAGSD